MSYEFQSYTPIPQVQICKAWQTKKGIIYRTVEYNANSPKALKKYCEFLKLNEEQEQKIKSQNWDKKLYPKIITMNNNFLTIYLNNYENIT